MALAMSQSRSALRGIRSVSAIRPTIAGGRVDERSDFGEGESSATA